MVDANPYAPPRFDDAPAPGPAPARRPRSSSEKRRFPAGARLAGVCLIVNGLLIMTERLTVKPGPGTSIIPLLDFFLGVALLAGQRTWRAVALLRCLYGALALGCVALLVGDAISFVMQLALSTVVAALLVGNPSPWRILGALLIFAVAAAAAMMGLAASRAARF